MAFSRKARTLGVLLFVFLIGLVVDGALRVQHHDLHEKELLINMVWFTAVIIAAFLGACVGKIKQATVIGQILAGVVLGNLTMLGIDFFADATKSLPLEMMGTLGVIILLFLIGIESNMNQMRLSLGRGGRIAGVGVAVPQFFGTLVAALCFWEIGFRGWVFFGATLTATSVGVVVQAMMDLGVDKTEEAQRTKSAALIDDVSGIVTLAVVAGAIQGAGHPLAILFIMVAKSFVFLGAAALLGDMMAKSMAKFFSRISSVSGMKVVFALSFALIWSLAAHLVGLEYIIGSFAAGLVLDPVVFKYFKRPEIAEDLVRLESDLERASSTLEALIARLEGTNLEQARSAETIIYSARTHLKELEHDYSHRHVEELIKPVGDIFIPIFFVLTGMKIQLALFVTHPLLLPIALLVTAVALWSKYVVAHKRVSGDDVDGRVIGWAMTARGEVGIVFANRGKQLGVFTPEIFSVLILVVLLTTIIAPVMIRRIYAEKEGELEAEEVSAREPRVAEVAA